MEQNNLADLYHTDPIPWSRAAEQLETAAATSHPEDQASPTTWLTTTRSDGQPHAAAVGAMWTEPLERPGSVVDCPKRGVPENDGGG